MVQILLMLCPREIVVHVLIISYLAGNGSSGGNVSGSNGEEGKHGSNMAERSGSGADTDPCEKDGNGTSKIDGDPAEAAP